MANNYESLKTDGHYTMARKIFTKIKNWVESKVGTDVPANAVFTDEKVTQTPTSNATAPGDYEVLFSWSPDNTAHTESARKDQYITYDPYKHSFTIGNRYPSSTKGNKSTAFGEYIKASGFISHAEGYFTEASGNYSHVEGHGTIANHRSQHVFGEFNLEDDSTAASTERGNYIEIVGNGTGQVSNNARTLDWNGNEWVNGNYYDVNGKLAHKSLTEAQYNLLSQAQQEDGTEYFVTDRVPLQICDYIYPIGSIYMSVNNISPSVLFGGTWERIEDRFLLAAGSTYNVGATGGEAEHTLIVDEMPSHKHAFCFSNHNGYLPQNSTSPGAIANAKSSGTTCYNGMIMDYAGTSPTYNEGTLLGNKGGSQPHNNMPPYLVVNVWMRVPDPVEEEEEE